MLLKRMINNVCVEILYHFTTDTSNLSISQKLNNFQCHYCTYLHDFPKSRKAHLYSFFHLETGGCERKNSNLSAEKFSAWRGIKFARETFGNIATWTTTPKSRGASGQTASGSTSTVSVHLSIWNWSYACTELSSLNYKR